jgi:hypothetical protein
MVCPEPPRTTHGPVLASTSSTEYKKKIKKKIKKKKKKKNAQIDDHSPERQEFLEELEAAANEKRQGAGGQGWHSQPHVRLVGRHSGHLSWSSERH